MTVAIAPPFIHVEDANGNPYVGAKLYVYLVGTTTLASIYSDDALSVSISNPMTSDSAGNFARAYIAAGTYKLRAETSAAVLIWQYDKIDTNLGTGGTLAIASGGTSATTAAAARTALGAAAQTDVDNLSTEITTLQAQQQSLVASPQGRLTLTTATPILAADVSAGTSVFYTPYIGNQIPIWDGTVYALKTFAELTLTLSASHTANNIYDVFVFYDSSTVTIGTGPLWNTATAGAGARGTGAGTTELERKNGLWTNKNSMTARNGATTYTVAANKGTYVGSIFMDGTNGQCSCHVTYGQSRKWGVWNAYNRVPIILQSGDSTASWTAVGTLGPINSSSANSVKTFCGLPEEYIEAIYNQTGIITYINTGTSSLQIGIGLNSTTVASGYSGQFGATTNTATSSTPTACELARLNVVPGIGVNTLTMLEVGVNVRVHIGLVASCLMSTIWRG